MFFFFKQKTAYEMRISDWGSDVCSSDLTAKAGQRGGNREVARQDWAIAGGTRFFGESLRSMSVAWRRSKIEMTHQHLSIATQCRLLSISRSSYYYTPVPETEETLALMTEIRSEEHTSELQSLMRISYAVFCLKNKKE